MVCGEKFSHHKLYHNLEFMITFNYIIWLESGFVFHVQFHLFSVFYVVRKNPGIRDDEAMKNIYDDPNYTVLGRQDNDGYTVLTLLANENDINNNLHEIKMLYFVAVKKTGGLVKFNRSGSSG